MTRYRFFLDATTPLRADVIGPDRFRVYGRMNMTSANGDAETQPFALEIPADSAEAAIRRFRDVWLRVVMGGST